MKYWLLIGLALVGFACSESQDFDEESSIIDDAIEAPTNITTTSSPEVNPGKSVIVAGNIKNSAGLSLQLNYMSLGGMINKGAVALTEDGDFHFKVEQQEAGMYNLATASDNACMIYVQPEDSLYIQMDASDLLATCEILTDHEDAKSLIQFSSKQKENALALKSINTAMNQLDFSDNAGRQKYIKQSADLKDEFHKFKFDFIKNYPESPGLIFAMDQLGEDNLEEIKLINKAIQKKLPNTQFSQYTQDYLASVEGQKMMQTASQRIQKGMPAPELAFNNPDGKEIKLSDLKGKIVLLDFWASWCGPCRKESPNVVRAYNKYQAKGFEVFSFSLDKDPARWKAAIAQDGLIWPYHASDLKQWQTAAIPIYGFNSIPFTVLIDRDGKIIETNLRGPALEQKLKSLLG